MSTASVELGKLFHRLKTYKINDWGTSSKHVEQDTDRVEVEVSEADVVSSQWMDSPGRHALVLDIDHPAWLVKSSTPGHYHLYVDVPGGIEGSRYFALLQALRRAGVIEPGYETASIERGFSSVRLPWIKKEGG